MRTRFTTICGIQMIALLVSLYAFIYHLCADAGAIAIAAGKQHSLLLLADGSVWATGWGDTGRLGTGNLRRVNSFSNVVQYGQCCANAYNRSSPYMHNMISGVTYTHM